MLRDREALPSGRTPALKGRELDFVIINVIFGRGRQARSFFLVYLSVVSIYQAFGLTAAPNASSVSEMNLTTF